MLEALGRMIDVFEITSNDVDKSFDELEKYEDVVDGADRRDLVSGLITGNVAFDIEEGEGIVMRFWKWLKSFIITGNVISEQEDIVEQSEIKINQPEEIKTCISDWKCSEWTSCFN
ncbi:MAG: hypothetical protein IIC75_09730, partial [Bacteroidetes bacterium]|nr:hypothetical protein [Bacteroidota bacterium]